jgi:hypothetical protein
MKGTLTVLAGALISTAGAAQFIIARNAKHVDRPTAAQTLPAAFEWLWKGYPTP